MHGGATAAVAIFFNPSFFNPGTAPLATKHPEDADSSTSTVEAAALQVERLRSAS